MFALKLNLSFAFFCSAADRGRSRGEEVLGDGASI